MSNGPAVSSRTPPPREAPAQHKFKVQMYDFSCEGLVADGKCEPYLKIDFDSYKIFKTDHETMSPAKCEWGFRAGFQYVMHYLEKLRDRKLRVQCINRVNNQAVGQASIDLQTVACGPAYFRLTLFDRRQCPCGTLKFVCVMKMVSDLAVIFRDLQLTMQGCPAPAKLRISCSFEMEEAETQELNLDHSADGTWSGPFALSFEAALGDLLKVPDLEKMSFVVVDEMGTRQGEAVLAFRTCFTTKAETILPFKVDVTYSTAVQTEGEEKLEPVGAVGALEGNLVYQNIPVYAQMAGGCCIDGEIQGGNWLIEGLPYPQTLSQPPPLWREDIHHDLLEAFGTDLQPNEEHEINVDDIDDHTISEALEQIDLPPPWEKRRERAGDRLRVYFADPRSKRTTWKDPRFLPENWDQRIDAQSGKVYYQYHKTRETTYVDPRGCPLGWDMRLSKSGDIYFAFIPAMKTTFVDPRGLPEGFDAALDDLGRIYFKNHHDRSTAWEDPRDDQQEVTLTKWRKENDTRWWKEQVWSAIEEIQKQRSDFDDHNDIDEQNDCRGDHRFSDRDKH